MAIQQRKFILSVLKTGLRLRNRLRPSQQRAIIRQEKVLGKLLAHGMDTQFGKTYRFESILNEEHFVEAFQKSIPLVDYSGMYPWWQKSFNGEKEVCWPGVVPFFALSSGTSEDASKFIPVTKEMVKAIKRGGLKQTLALLKTAQGREALTHQTLMIGGSTDLEWNGVNFSGDLSGITTGNLPFWFRPMSVPPPEIRAQKNWPEKIDEIVRNAKDWNVGVVTGTCSWIQIIMERIIEHYQVKTIHDIWPNFQVLVHGGVMIDPFKKKFEEMFSREVLYFDTYMASEGFFAYQATPKSTGMRLMTGNQIFFEFVPFDSENFSEDGALLPHAKAITLNEVEPFVEYAMVISTCSGAWRYLIGDVVKFVSHSKFDIKIVGRTKHYLSICGEHLSMENMARAVRETSEFFNVSLPEFTVAGVPDGSLFAHHWFVACEENIDSNSIMQKIDEVLCHINDDYRVERKNAIKNLRINVIHPQLFVDWLADQGKSGAQVKFPKVLKKYQYESFLNFLKEKGAIQ